MALSPEEAHRRKLESARRWSQAHPEWGRQWRKDNPERERRYRENSRQRRAAYEEANREKIRAQKRDAEKRRQARLKAQEAHRQRDRDRAREWARTHPEEARARKQAWVEANREKVRSQKLAYYYRHHEERKRASREQSARRRQDPVARAQDARYREAERERYKAHADAYRADPAKRAAQNQYQNEWRRRERRRLQLGLPRGLVQRATKNERIDNEHAADAFFAELRQQGNIRRLKAELGAVHEAAAAHAVDQVVQSIALGVRIRSELERPERLATAVKRYLASPAGAELREEVHMNLTARRLRGAPPYPDMEAELRRRAEADLHAYGLPWNGDTPPEGAPRDMRKFEIYAVSATRRREAEKAMTLL